ncbi:hypothetical protein [Comamonas thiooxydans]|uniref:hypothetical protein n=1 Tax=Comamonas thiooxydans TaxID=363952 RepID=UPI00325FCD43
MIDLVLKNLSRRIDEAMTMGLERAFGILRIDQPEEILLPVGVARNFMQGFQTQPADHIGPMSEIDPAAHSQAVVNAAASGIKAQRIVQVFLCRRKADQIGNE